MWMLPPEVLRWRSGPPPFTEPRKVLRSELFTAPITVKSEWTRPPLVWASSWKAELEGIATVILPPEVDASTAFAA